MTASWIRLCVEQNKIHDFFPSDRDHLLYTHMQCRRFTFWRKLRCRCLEYTQGDIWVNLVEASTVIYCRFLSCDSTLCRIKINSIEGVYIKPYFTQRITTVLQFKEPTTYYNEKYQINFQPWKWLGNSL